MRYKILPNKFNDDFNIRWHHNYQPQRYVKYDTPNPGDTYDPVAER